MKKFSHAFYCRALFSVSALLLNPLLASSQTISVPVVTIHAPDPYATESGDPATFEVDRQGPTNATLNIYYDITGSASNGVDYKSISHFV